jgi:hypothetical protein
MMAVNAYVGIDGIARKAVKMYVGVDGIARSVRAGYVGVDGVARKFWPSLTQRTRLIDLANVESAKPSSYVYDYGVGDYFEMEIARLTENSDGGHDVAGFATAEEALAVTWEYILADESKDLC